MISEIVNLKQNILAQPTKQKNIEITAMRQYYITSYFTDSDEEIIQQ